MKTLGNKSLSAILLAITNVVWWIEWIASITIIGVIIIVPFFKKSIDFNAPVTFSTTNLKNLASTGLGYSGGNLKVTEGNFFFPVQTTLQNVLGMLVIVGVVSAFFILVTYQLKLIFSSFKRDDPFVEFNMSRIRKIGFMLIIYFFLQLSYTVALNRFLMGIILIVIAEIFKRGAVLDNEQKYTI